ncbi:tRNA threonylcarbamoyl adenosine modification protein YeaZ [Alkalithermobacter thermoalcaliphilus JW-YL-7 = DSM 7308]|uniref:Universal protein YeaZ n=1 Tax=Alkalithermobacter thermoalcaliphilus JW-YL-7 = DSM 7308 TaxID=1121328 RepID=A0A150FN92_CLOPD|nr:universal protein YeaZ [[Clostridium] paradoxum JW-YL-7 = DSM 7308]SHL06783.1 tRNA threonylcarbamoyl adenosine modification protein YeaZ [[Clostridium] paradoxum JW-YL-7 = DSM 7308]
MKVLGIDTSSKVAAVAIMDEDKLIGEYIINSNKSHSEKLMPIIQEIFSQCNLTVDDIDLVAVCIGPGSFTGLRIGVATAKSIAHSKQIPIVCVNSLETLAFNMNLSKGIICPIIDAQRNDVYTSKYTWENNSLLCIEDISVKNIDVLIDQIKDRYEQIIVVGDAVDIHKEKLESLNNIYISPNSHKVPRASSVCQIALEKYKNNIIDDYMTANPLYIRKSQAEVEYEERQRRMGENG